MNNQQNKQTEVKPLGKSPAEAMMESNQEPSVQTSVEQNKNQDNTPQEKSTPVKEDSETVIQDKNNTSQDTPEVSKPASLESNEKSTGTQVKTDSEQVSTETVEKLKKELEEEYPDNVDNEPMTTNERILELEAQVKILHEICDQLYWTASRQYSAPNVYDKKLALDKRYKLSEAERIHQQNNRG